MQWNVDDLYSLDQEQALLDEVTTLTTAFVSKREQMTSSLSSKEIYDLILEYEKLRKKASVLASRPHLEFSISSDDQSIQQRMQRLDTTLTDLGNQLIFFSQYIRDLTPEQTQGLLETKYANFVKYIQEQKPHTRTESEEQLLNLKELSGVDVLNRLHKVVTSNFTFDWDGEEVGEEVIMNKCQDSDLQTRIKAYDAVLHKYKDNEAIIAELLKGIVVDWATESTKIRNYPTPLSMRNVSEHIQDDTVHTAIKVIRSKHEVFAKFFALKSKALGIPNSRYHVYAPIGDVEKEYSYDEAKEIVLDVYKKFSPRAYELANNIFAANHVDVMPKKGKRGGAFCSSISPDIMPYIMLNFTGELEDLYTIAHEFGHGIHSQCSGKESIFYESAPLPLAEVASNFGELLLHEALLEEADEHTKKLLLFRGLGDHYKSISRQISFFLFEEYAHDAIPKGVTTQELHNKFQELITEFHPGMEVPQEFSWEWLRMPHMFFAPFYVYSYALAILIALSFFKQYKEDKEAFIPKYFAFLERGSNGTCEEIMQAAGFDITQASFWEDAFSIIEEQLTELEKLV